MNTNNPQGGGREDDEATTEWPGAARPGPGQPPAQGSPWYPGPPPGSPQYPQPRPGGAPQGWYPPPPHASEPITVQPKAKGRGPGRGLVVGAAFLAGLLVAGGAFAAYEFSRDDSRPSAAEPTNTWPPKTTPSSTPTASSTPTSSPTPAANVDPAALRGYLLSAAELDGLLQTTGMVPGGVTSELAVGGRTDEPTPPQCLSTWGIVNKSTYSGAPTTGVAAQVVGEKPLPYHQAQQGLVAFRDDASARAFLDQQVRTWAECQNRPMVVNWGGGDDDIERLRVGPSAVNGEMLTVAVERESNTGGESLRCERAMTVRRNVVVDVRACRPTEPLVAAAVAQALADRIEA